MTGGVLAGNGMSAALAKQEVQYSPKGIIPYVFTYPERGRHDVAYFQLIISRLIESGKVDNSEFSDGRLLPLQ